jgi:capping protein alpha
MRTFTFDFLTRTVGALDADPLTSTSLRSTMQSIVQKFAEEAVHNGNCAVYDAADGVTIVISGSSISKENFRTGSLVMRFALKSSGELTGTIALHAHFYENGNAVSEQASEFKDTVPGSSDDDKSANLVKKISAFYTTWTKGLQEGFELLTSEGLDKLRRKLPIMKTYVNWRQELIGAAAMPAGKK